jgi:hypothetical protein
MKPLDVDKQEPGYPPYTLERVTSRS